MCPHDLIYLRAPRLLLRLQLFSSHSRGPFKIFISDISLRSPFRAQPTHTVSLCFPPPLFVCRVQSVTQRVTTAGFCVCLPITEPPVTELAVAARTLRIARSKKRLLLLLLLLRPLRRPSLSRPAQPDRMWRFERRDLWHKNKSHPTEKSITL